jgi:signal transduction histidine kinase/ActR/RegA family two-component response regulator
MLSTGVGSSPGAGEMFRALLGEGVALAGAAAGGLFLLDETGANLELTFAVRFPETLADRYRMIPLSASLPLVDTVKTVTPAFLTSFDDYVARYPDYARAHPDIANKAFVALPLVADTRCLGALALGFTAPRGFTDELRGQLVEWAGRCAKELEAARHLDGDHGAHRLAGRASQRLERLHAFTGALSQASTPAEVGEAVVAAGIAATGASSGALWLSWPEGADGPTHTPVADAVRDGLPVWIESRNQLAERYPAGLGPVSRPDEESLACLPLFAQGRPIGALTYGFAGTHRFLEDERALLMVISWYAAHALERANAYAAEKGAKERAEDGQRRSQLIADIDVLLASSLDYSNILSDVARAAVPRFADWCVLELSDQRLAGTPPIASHADPSKVPLVLEMRQRLREFGNFRHGIAAVMRSGNPQLHASISLELVRTLLGGDERLLELAASVGVSSTMVVPVSARGQVAGVILLSRTNPAHPFDDQDLAMVEELGRRIGLAVDNARLYQEARDANRTKDEFLAVLSHELRNPLAPIVTTLQLLDRRGETSLVGERAMISRHVRHLVRLIDDLLDVARTTSGKVQLVKERCELASIVAAAIEMASPLLEQRAHRLMVSSPEHDVQVIADRTRLTQAIANLLNNAAKYTEPGGGITVRASAEGTDAVIRVRDSGVGIAPELLPRIFDPFVQATNALDRSQGGLGLGLTVARTVVNLHGGTVSAHSAGIGGGSEFVVRLPRAETAVAVSKAAQSDRTTPPVGDRRRVLAVDDNTDAAAALGQALEALGCSARVVHDGASALAAAAAFHPALVLLDIGLPGIDGYEVARRLRALRLDSPPRIVAVTGYGQPADRARALEAGFDDHVVKPMTLEELERLLGDDHGTA